MTYCGKFGYKDGDEFINVSAKEFQFGEKITLKYDDGSDAPLFVNKDGDEWYVMLKDVQSINHTSTLQHLRGMCVKAQMSVVLRTNGDLQVWDDKPEDYVTVRSELEVLEILNIKIAFLKVWDQFAHEVPCG